MTTITLFRPYREFAVSLAKEAGAVLLEWYEGELTLTTKSSDIDLVTQADKASEALIIARIQEQFPDHAILAEESGELSSESEFRWIVDPLDGTTNFAHGFPVFCVSIALQQGNETIVGVLYDPLSQELFWAERGGGAWLDSPRHSARRLQVTTINQLSRALVATGFAYQRATLPTNNIAEFERTILRIQDIRRAGSAALDLAYVAAGRVDGYWEYHVQPWDVAAGALLVEEAGGILNQITGEAWNPWSPSIVACNPELMPVLLSALQGEDES
jgi:myo-inositol-1(or 4)-monophosphatase